MAVTVINRPQGHKLGTEVFTATAVTNGMDGLVYFDGPNELTDGQYVYIESNIESYNGFWKVLLDVTFPTSVFSVQRNADSPFQDFIQTTEITFYEVDISHGWQCVHLPIVYELESDLYPGNTVDTVITITPYGDVNGYFAVTHSALTGSDELFALDYVKLADGRVLQVVEIVSSTITVLNFDGSGSISTMQKVRNNYHIDVKVYAGLPAGHPWESEKPYELATTLRFIPDSNNQIKFSIAEILKGYINTRNNLTLDTLPNNIDFFTAFYIEYAEGYDVSNGTEITAFLDEFTDDSEEFEGYAVNAMLPFKNLYSGYMSQYVDSTEVLARWLTTMDVPIIFVGLFFDLSFINTHEGDIKINKNGVLYLTITNPGIGVLRVPIEAENGDTELCIQASAEMEEIDYNIAVFSGGEDWTIGADASVSLGPLESSSELSQAVSLPAGTYTIAWDITVSGSDGLFTIKYKKDSVLVSNFGAEDVTNGSNTGSKTITLTDSADELTFQITNSDGGGVETDYTLTAISISGEQYITESICLQVVSECNTFIADDLRLIETGPFRELE